MKRCKIPNKKLHCGIYGIKKNGVIEYIGKSKRIEIRIRSYEYKLRKPIAYEVLEECEESLLSERERYWIAAFLERGIELTNTNVLHPIFKIPKSI